MSDISPNLELPLIMPSQAQKHVTVNEALLRLDALVQTRVESLTTTAQPASPLEGQAWILPAAATGDDWSLMSAASLAVFRDGFWTEIPPRPGWRVHMIDTADERIFDGAAWRHSGQDQVLAETPHGAQTRAILLEETVSSLTGPQSISTIVIPARSIVFCVSVRVAETITGAASFDCGIAGEASKFGGSLGIAVGSENIGVIGPTAFYSDTPVELHANGGDFGGGSVRLAIHAWCPRAPAS
jgi:hypothetical protein